MCRLVRNSVSLFLAKILLGSLTVEQHITYVPLYQCSLNIKPSQNQTLLPYLTIIDLKSFMLDLFSLSPISCYMMCCMFQILPITVVEETKLAGSLEILQAPQNKVFIPSLSNPENSVSARACNASIELWHCRLGHVPFDQLHHLPFIKNDAKEKHKICHVCPRARQHMNSFPISSIKTSLCFELIHVDNWGP